MRPARRKIEADLFASILTGTIEEVSGDEKLDVGHSRHIASVSSVAVTANIGARNQFAT
jgi:hypothetical protein